MAWLSREDEEGIRLPLEDEFNLAPGSLITHLSHSHGAPFTDPLLADAPGGHLIQYYRKQILKTCRQLLSEALENKMSDLVTQMSNANTTLTNMVNGVNTLVAIEGRSLKAVETTARKDRNQIGIV